MRERAHPLKREIDRVVAAVQACGFIATGSYVLPDGTIHVDVREDPKAKPRQIYLIQACVSKHVKIGIARNVQARLNTLRTANAEPLVLLHSYPGSEDDERALHEKLAAYRLQGEWFRAGPWLKETLARVKVE